MSEIHDFQNIIQRYVRLDKRGHVAEVVLDRAVALNKMDEQFFVYFQKCIDQADQSPDIRAILIWAEGTDFSVGLDLKASSRIIGALPSYLFE